MADRISVALITNKNGPHLNAYLQILAQLEEVDRVYFCDESKRHVNNARKKLGGKLKSVYADLHLLFKQQELPLVIIAMDAKSTPAAINSALDAGCHVFAEKPACTKVEEFEPLVQKADSKHLNIMLALSNRANPEVQAARQMIKDGVIGKIYGVEIKLIDDQTRLQNKAYQSSWFADKTTAGGGHLTWLGIHWLDMGMYITNSDITDVTGFTTNIGGEPINIEDSAVLSFRFDKGFLGSQSSGYYLKGGNHSAMNIWGSKGWVSMNPFTGQHLQWALNSEPRGAVHKFDKPVQPRAYLPFVRSAVRSAMNLEPPPITSQESLRVLRTIFAFYKAVETGMSQKVMPN